MNAPLRSVLPPAAPSNDEAPPDSGRIEANPSVDVRCESDAVRVILTDPRRSSIDAFAALSPGQRKSLALDGWKLGLRTVLSAYRLAEESRMEDIGRSLVAEVEQRLNAHLTQQQTAFRDALQGYFHPRDGQVTQRLEAFVKDGGELSRTLSQFLAPKDGALAKTLASQVGAESPLLRKLSPTDAEGVVCLIQRHVEAALRQNQAEITRTLDPLAPDGAMARLLGELRREVSGAEKDQAEQLLKITKALDPNDETSMMGRVQAESRRVSQTIAESMSSDRPGSMLATLKVSLSGMIEGHQKHQAEVLEAFLQRQQQIEHSVQELVTRLTTQRAANEKSPRGGVEFEDALERFTVAAVSGGHYVVDRVGSRTGPHSRRKVGDFVVRFEPGSPYAGSTLVIEAKRAEGYTVAKALDELALARSNRCASVGLFVFAAGHAPPGFSGIRRFGEDILVAWDPEDPATDPYLEAALCLGLALAARGQRVGDEGDIKALADIESRIADEIKRHTAVRTLAERIRHDAEEIARMLETSDGKLGVLLRNAKKTLNALNVELEDAAAAREVPVELPTGSLAKARKALRAADDGQPGEAAPSRRKTNA
jgi:hypothetical protein